MSRKVRRRPAPSPAAPAPAASARAVLGPSSGAVLTDREAPREASQETGAAFDAPEEASPARGGLTSAGDHRRGAGDPPLDGDGAPRGPGRIDSWLSEIRFHHFFNLVFVGLLLALCWQVPQLTILPLYLALVARIPSLHLQKRFQIGPTRAGLIVAFIAFLVLIATAMTLLLPIVLQAATIDRDALDQVRPIADGLAAWANALLDSFGLAPPALGLEGPITREDLVEWLTKDTGEGVRTLLSASGVVLKPFLLVALSLLVVFMASYALLSSRVLKRETRRFLRVCWPPRTVAIIERMTLHAQYFGAEVFRGYSWMVLVLGISYFVVYLGAIAFFPEAQGLPPVMVVALILLSAVIGAVPGLGAKILLVLGAVAGVAVGAAAYYFTGSVWLGVYIFAAFVVVTGFESKFGTPSTLGRALGVNSCLMLFLAIGAVAGFGVGATLWAIFVVLPILVAGMRVMVELYGDRPELEHDPIPPLERRG